jgi:hypothetical protein
MIGSAGSDSADRVVFQLESCTMPDTPSGVTCKNNLETPGYNNAIFCQDIVVFPKVKKRLL